VTICRVVEELSGVLQQGVVEEWSVAARGSGGRVVEERSGVLQKKFYPSLPDLPDYHTQHF
jgi:hypothetical protein